MISPSLTVSTFLALEPFSTLEVTDLETSVVWLKNSASSPNPTSSLNCLIIDLTLVSICWAISTRPCCLALLTDICKSLEVEVATANM